MNGLLDAGARARSLLALALLCVALGALGGCFSKPPAKPPTEAEMRSHWTSEQTARAIASVNDAPTSAALNRYFARRAGEAHERGMKLSVESVMVGEDMGIGGGLSMKRLFALYHEYNDEQFASYLAGLEVIDGRVRDDFRRQVGGSKIAFVKLDFAELNRAILTAYTFAQGDPPCCPSRQGKLGFELDPSGLYPLE